MSYFFILIYRFFRCHLWLFYLLLGVSVVIIVFLASRLKLEEDISGISSGSSAAGKDQFAIRNFKFAEKLVVHIFQADSTALPLPDTLIQIAEEFGRQVSLRFDSEYIRTLVVHSEDTMVSAIIQTVRNSLPLFLTEEDYLKLDSLTTPGTIGMAVRRNYKTLISPASIIVKNQILTDPLGIQSIGLQKLTLLQTDDRYELYHGHFFTKDKRHLFVFITPSSPPSETVKNTRLINGIDDVIRSVRTNQKYIKVEYFGSGAIAVGNATQLKKDIILTLSIAVFLIVLLLGWYFRSVAIPFLGFLPALFGGGFALSILALTKGTVSAIALGIGSVILGLIIDYALYMVNLFRQKGSVETVLREMSQTIFVCCLTTAGAFLCLIFLDSSVLHDLGWFAALSVAGAAFFALVILPHFLSVKWIRPGNSSRKTMVDFIAGIDFEKKWMVLVCVSLIGFICLFFFQKVSFENDLSSFNFVPDQLKEAEKNLDRLSTSGLKNVFIVSLGENMDEALRNNEMVLRVTDSLQEQGLIRQYSGVRYLLQSDSLMKTRIARWERYWTSSKKRLVQQVLSDSSRKLGFTMKAFDPFYQFLNKVFAPIPKEQTVVFRNVMFSDWINETQGVTMISGMVKVKSEEKPNVYRAFEKKSGVIVFDRQNLTTRFVSNVKHDFDFLVRWSMILVTLLLLVSFGRLEIALTTALPMFFSWLVTLGFMGFTGIKFNIFNIIVSSFIFGLGVDYSILMMRGLLHEYKVGSSERDSYKVAIILSSATTLFGVIALFFAKHPALRSVALISVVGIVMVVITTFSLQPLLTKWFLFDRIKKHRFPVTARIVVKTFITWGNIVLIAIIMMILGTIIYALFPVSRETKKDLFHKIFSLLCRLYIFITFPTNGKLFNPYNETFTRPCVIISNHQSLIETPAFLRLHPKIIILTSEWVFKSPVFGPIARMAGFINTERGLEENMDKLRKKMEDGYSLLVFPEAHRSADGRIQRFHRGAFYIAETLRVDILPIAVFGSGHFLARGDFWGKPNGFRMHILERIPYDDPLMGQTYQERTRQFRRFYIKEYERLQDLHGDTFYYRKKLLLNYLFKGPILEWYLRIKMKLENNYNLYTRLLPRHGTILDLGCGYGFISYMLSFTAPGRKITCVDYDDDKIRIARHCFSANEQLEFLCADITRFDFNKQDGILLCDVLHYLPHEKQINLLIKCIENLNKNGVILIREAVSDLVIRHKRSKVTEFFSTRIGFNRTGDPEQNLYFLSAETIKAIAMKKNLRFEITDQKKLTSNIFISLTRNEEL